MLTPFFPESEVVRYDLVRKFCLGTSYKCESDEPISIHFKSSIETSLSFISKLYGINPNFRAKRIPAILKNLREHRSYIKYRYPSL